MERPRSLFGPLLLIAAGIIWLLVKSGSLPAANLWALTHIWPYLLIAAGVGIMVRPYWKYVTILLDVVIIGGAVLAILYAPKLGWANPSIVYSVGDNNLFLGPRERGSGVVKTETRKVTDFHAIEINYPAEVTITQGETASVKVEAEDNLLPGFVTEVKNGRLDISYKPKDNKFVNATKLVKITIVVKDLDDIQFSSAGELTINDLKTDKLDFGLDGAGKVTINNITTKGLQLRLSGAGSMAASGTADDLSMNISGFGSFDGKDLHSQTADVNLSGAGSATVWVDDNLSANISGAGSVNYYGAASVSKQIGGLGSVNHLGDK